MRFFAFLSVAPSPAGRVGWSAVVVAVLLGVLTCASQAAAQVARLQPFQGSYQPPYRGVGGAVAARVAGAGDASWDTQFAQPPVPGGTVKAVATLANGDVLAGGYYYDATKGYQGFVKRWTGTAWQSLGTGPDALVHGLAVAPNGNVYAALDSLPTLGSPFENYHYGHVACWNGTTWQNLPSIPFDSNDYLAAVRQIMAITVAPNGDVLIGGGVDDSEGVYGDVLRWNGTTWQRIGSVLDGGYAKAVALTGFGDGMVAGGDFFGSYWNLNNVARWDGQAWQPLGSGVVTSGAVTQYNGHVDALAVAPNGDVYVGGTFTDAAGPAGDYIIRWDGTAWQPLDGGVNGPVQALAFAANGDLLVGGTFTAAGGNSNARYIARWTSAGWQALGTGLNGRVSALATRPTAASDVIAGGTFTTVGDGSVSTQGVGIYHTPTASPAPTLTSFTPTSGLMVTTVTLTGTNFVGATRVRFNGTSTTFTINSATSITATVPLGATTGPISVVTPSGTATSAASFTVTTPVPTITSFSPSSAAVGQTVTLTGTGFGGAATVKLNSTAASFTVASMTSISAVVPAGAASGPFAVTTAGGTATSAASFKVTPVITSFTPTSAGAGTPVVITGTSFMGTTAVAFGSVAATFTVNSDTQITTTVPAATVSGSIRVTTPSGSFLGPVFTFVPAPTISSLSPATGAVGTLVTLTGSSFTGATAVKFGGVPAPFSVCSATSLVANVPAGATTGPITVMTSGGTATSSSFTVLPGVVSFSPLSGLVGTTVTLTGTNFTGATSVTFATNRAATFTVNSDTQITATVPTSSVTGTITITTPAGAVTTAQSFKVGAAPFVLTQLSPVGNATAVSPASNVALTFSQNVTAATASNTAVKIHSVRRGGLLTGSAVGGTFTGGGTPTVTFNPTTDFSPGEVISVTATKTGASTGGATLTRPQVHQFRVAAAAAPATFGGGSDVLLAGVVNYLAVGDLDGDGDQDLVARNRTTSSVAYVRFNQGDGTFTTGTDLVLPDQYGDVAVGDVDGDGDLDLLFSTWAAIAIRLNNGAGIFSGTGSVSSGTGETRLAVGDLDSDGDLDVLTAELSSSMVSTRFNNGSGTFSGGANVSVGTGHAGVTLADMDQDGDLDAVLINSGNTAVILFNNGQGVMTAGPEVFVGGNPREVAVADVDGDLDLDLLTASQGPASVSVRFNFGNGTFSGGADWPAGSSAYGMAPQGLTTGDVDGDGDVDVLVAAGQLVRLLNNGDGTFSAGTTYPVAGGPVAVATADLDGDGDLDALTTSTLGKVSVRLNVPLPAINSLAPASGPEGSVVILTGANLTGVTSVKFGAVAASSFTVNSATQLTVTVPAGATTDLITVAKSVGTAVSATAFTVTPAISGFTPTSGQPGATVVLTGTTLLNATTVRFNGTPTLFMVNSATQISARVPNGATTGPLSVTTPSGTATSVASFTVGALQLPKVTSFSPTSGVVGTSVTLTGTNFTGATSVRFGSVAASSFTVNSATSITVIVPTDALKSQLTVTTPGGTATSAGYFMVKPAISAFTPASGVPGTLVTITGQSFGGATIVRFGTGSASSFTVVSNTSITASVPATATTGKVYVTTPGGLATSATNFTAAPVISSFTPASGAPGSVVVLTGLNFTSATSVKFNGVAATTSYSSATQLTATVPAAATTGLLTVSSATGATSSATSFTVTSGSPPTISSFSPGSGALGTVVTITGTGFTGATAVRFNTVTTSAVTVLSATQVQAAVPTGASTGKVFVATPTGMTQSATSFTVYQPPTIGSFSPTSGPVSTVITINGTNLSGASAVRFNGVAATSYTVVNATRITATVPAGASTGKLSAVTVGGTAQSAANFTVTGMRTNGPLALAPEEMPAAQVALYPNPAHESVQVSGLVPGTGLSLLDGLGRVVASTAADAAGLGEFRLTGLAPGIYVVRSGVGMQRLVVE